MGCIINDFLESCKDCHFCKRKAHFYGEWQSGRYYRTEDGDTFSVKTDFVGNRQVFYHGNVNSSEKQEMVYWRNETVDSMIEFVD